MTALALRTAGKPAVISIKSRTRHWEFPKDRLEDTTPTLHDPVAVADDAAPPGTGWQLCGTYIGDLDATTIIVDVTPGMVYHHNVDNILTYSAGAPATYGAFHEGAVVYYDRSADLTAGCLLSLSPLDENDVPNPPFGRVVFGQYETAADFPKASTSRGQVGCAIMQFGIGAPQPLSL